MKKMYAVNDHITQEGYKKDPTNQVVNDYTQDQYKNIYNHQEFVQGQYDFYDSSKYPAQYYYNSRKDDLIPYGNNQSHKIAARNHENSYSNESMLNYDYNYSNSCYLHDDSQNRTMKEVCQSHDKTNCTENYKNDLYGNFYANDRIYKDVNLLLDESQENNSMSQQNSQTYEFNYNTLNVEYNYLDRHFYQNQKENLINSVCTNKGYNPKNN